MPTLTKRIHTDHWDAQCLVTDWLRRRWIRSIRPGYYGKTARFGRNDLAHLKPEIFPLGRWSQRDLMNARLDDLIEQHHLRRNKDRRVFWADQIESVLERIQKWEAAKP